MRTVELGRTAAQAELLVIKRQIRRQAMRVVWGLVAAVFLIAVLVMVHAVIFAVLTTFLAPIWATLVLLGLDLAFAVVFLLMALRGGPDALEAEARVIRDQALLEMRESIAIEALLAPATRLAFRRGGSRNIMAVVVSTIASRFLASRRR